MAARRPGRRPRVKPVFRVLVHHKYLAVWNELADRVGLANPSATEGDRGDPHGVVKIMSIDLGSH